MEKQTEFANFKKLSDYDNILITDEKGKIIFYDLADLKVLKVLGFRPEDFMGKHITSFYQDLTEETSTIMSVLKSGKPIVNIRQELLTKNGNPFITINSTFPIIEEDKIIGAIEFSKHLFTKEDIQSLDKMAGHKIYRKNNTIYTIDDIISNNPTMKSIKSKLQRMGKTHSTVLIYGRTGTGKEVIAQAIHNLSDRFEKPFISLNCGAVPPTLLESTLFGTTKGSFTGAEDTPGLFEQADGGTLFLDEINSLDISLQVKLLKAIEEKNVRRIGGKKNISVNIRVISATNEDPEILVTEKRLREDLFYRLGIVQIDLPPLKDRKEDIELFVEHFIQFYNSNMNMHIAEVNTEVLECFKRYDWPGNIRELKNAIETAYNNAVTSEITLEDIPQRIRKYREPVLGEGAIHGLEGRSLKDAVEEYEKQMILHELHQSNGVMAEAGRRLGVSKQALKYKMEKYNLR